MFRRYAMNPGWCGALVLLAGVATPAQPLWAEQKYDAERIEREALRMATFYDTNAQDKYVMDNSFSTVHAMAAYRALLEWADEGAEAEDAAEVHALVAAGLKAALVESGIGVPAEEGGAVGVLFSQAQPRYAQEPDPTNPATLRWMDEGIERSVSAASMGHSLAAKAVVARRLAGAEDDVLAEHLHDSLAAELSLLTQEMFLAKGADAAGRYVPERIVLDEQGSWRPASERSRLFGQAALLLGLTEVSLYLEQPLSGRGVEAMRRHVKEAIERVYAGIRAHHHDAASGVHAAIYDPQGEEERRYLLEDSALLVEALHRMAQVSDSPELRGALQQQLRSEAEFVVQLLAERRLAPRGLWLKHSVDITGTVTALAEQIAAMNILLLALEWHEEPSFREQAAELFSAIEETFWAQWPGIYRTAEGYTVSAYDGYLFATLLQWLQRCERAGFDVGDGRASTLFELIIKKGGMQQADTTETGEGEAPRAFLAQEAPLLAEEIAELPEREQRPQVVRLARRLMDQDGDSVPGRRFAGRPYGGAPVLIRQVSVRTPFVRAESEDTPEKGAGDE